MIAFHLSARKKAGVWIDWLVASRVVLWYPEVCPVGSLAFRSRQVVSRDHEGFAECIADFFPVVWHVFELDVLTEE